MHFFGADVSQSSLIDTPRNSVGEDARRSTRIERSVPLIVFGQNRTGEPFVERTVSTSLNLHGCRYPSRHDYGVGSWVTLQVGVELENPGNVWGIVTPPQDWMSAGGTNAALAQFATSVAPASDPPPMPLKLEEAPLNAEHRM